MRRISMQIAGAFTGPTNLLACRGNTSTGLVVQGSPTLDISSYGHVYYQQRMQRVSSIGKAIHISSI